MASSVCKAMACMIRRVEVNTVVLKTKSIDAILRHCFCYSNFICIIGISWDFVDANRIRGHNFVHNFNAVHLFYF